MAYVKLSNGTVLTWDDTISVGTLITTANEGFHVLAMIEYGDINNITPGMTVVEHDTPDQCPPTFKYLKVLKGDGKKSQSRKGACSAALCKAVTKDDVEAMLLAEKAAADAKREALLKMV